MPVGWAIGAAALGTVASGVIQADASKDAARTQRAGASDASAVQQNMYNQSAARQAPYEQAGYAANDTLSRLLGIAPSSNRGGISSTGQQAGAFDVAAYLRDNPDVAAGEWSSQNPEEHWKRYGRNEGRVGPTIQATQGAGGGDLDAQGYAQDNTGLATGYLSQTFGPEQFKAGMDPGYQWRVQQGNQGTMNSAAAGSGSLSGPALKALMDYNQGAASQEYGSAFDRFQTQQGNIYQRLSGIANLGQNAAANVGAQGVATGANIGANIVGAANAGAAGQIGAANAYSGALSDLGSLGYIYANKGG